jgi:coenzyme PQQ precursor peptide PqqA
MERITKRVPEQWETPEFGEIAVAMEVTAYSGSWEEENQPPMLHRGCNG